jgi:hypothetical protein
MSRAPVGGGEVSVFDTRVLVYKIGASGGWEGVCGEETYCWCHVFHERPSLSAPSSFRWVGWVPIDKAITCNNSLGAESQFTMQDTDFAVLSGVTNADGAVEMLGVRFADEHEGSRVAREMALVQQEIAGGGLSSGSAAMLPTGPVADWLSGMRMSQYVAPPVRRDLRP